MSRIQASFSPPLVLLDLRMIIIGSNQPTDTMRNAIVMLRSEPSILAIPSTKHRHVTFA